MYVHDCYFFIATKIDINNSIIKSVNIPNEFYHLVTRYQHY